MNIKDLEAVSAVNRYKSFSDAAYKIEYSPSAISKQIARVEEELGVQIFERKIKGGETNLTEIGEILVPEIDKLLDDYSNITYLAENWQVQDAMHLTIGIVPLIGTIGETDILTKFMTSHPETQIDYVYGSVSDLLRMLMSGSLDGAFMLLMGAYKGNFKSWEALTHDELSISYTMRNDSLYIGMSEMHACAKKEEVRIEDIINETFIFSNFQNPNTYATRIGVIQSLYDGIPHILKTRFMDFTKKDLVLRVVESGQAMLPQVVEPMLDGRKIVYKKINGWPDTSYGVFVKRKSNRSTALKDLSLLVKKYSQEKYSFDITEE